MYNENNNDPIGTNPSVDNSPIVDDTTTTTGNYSYGTTASGSSFEDNNYKFAGGNMPGNSSKKKFIIPVVIVAVLALGATAVFAFKDTILNTFNKSFASPAEYYKSVVKGEMDESLDAYLDTYEESIKLMQSDNWGASLSAKVELGDAVSTLLQSAAPQLASIKSATIDASMGTDNDGLSYNMGAKINDANLLSANVYLPYALDTLYLQIPEISGKYITGNLDMTSEDIEEVKTVFGKIFDYEYMPDSKQIKKLVNTYSDVYFDYLIETENVTKKEVKIDIEDIKQEVTELTISLDGDELCDLAMDFVDVAKDDKNIEEIITTFITPLEEIAGESSGFDAKEMYESIASAKEPLKELKKTAKEYKDIIKIVTYVNDDGEVMGNELIVKANDNEIKYSSIMAISGGTFGYNMNLSANDVTYLSIAGEGTSNFADTTAEFELVLSDGSKSYTVDIDVKDCDTTKLISGVFKGEISLKTDLIPDAKLVITIDQTAREGAYSFDVVYGGAEYAKFALNYALTDSFKSLKPSASAEIIDSNNEADLAAYLADFDPEKFITDFLTNANIDLTYQDLESIMTSLSDSLSGTSTYDDDYDWEDDYSDDYSDDFDWEDDYSDDDSDDFDWEDDYSDDDSDDFDWEDDYSDDYSDDFDWEDDYSDDDFSLDF